MQPDLPWNVAGIPPEAREAARAAARREGLSVGEWLTRRILRGLQELGLNGSEAPARENWQKPAAPLSREPPVSETDAVLATAAGNDNDNKIVYKRVEEQLRNVSRRLEATERAQSDNSRAMSKAATEINIATREQAQAFDQLGSHVVTLADRLGRVEQQTANDTVKDAVRNLHQGLSRLADQISQTANQSASQIETLAGNVQAVVGKLGAAEQASRSLEDRIASIAERVAAVERTAQANAATIERALDTLDRTQSASTTTGLEIQRQAASLAQVNEALNRLTARVTQGETQTATGLAKLGESMAHAADNNTQTASAIARLEDNFMQAQNKAQDSAFDRRLLGIERGLADVGGRLDTAERSASNNNFEESVRSLAQRVDAADQHHREAVAELRAAVRQANGRLENLEPQVKQAIAAQTAPPPKSTRDMLPFPDIASPAQSQPVLQQPAASPPPQEAFVPLPIVPNETLSEPSQPFGAHHSFGADSFAAAATQRAGTAMNESFIAATRRSARESATSSASPANASGMFGWATQQSAGSNESENKSGLWRNALIISLVLLVIVAVIAGKMLSGLFGERHTDVAPRSVHNIARLSTSAAGAGRFSTAPNGVGAPAANTNASAAKSATPNLNQTAQNPMGATYPIIPAQAPAQTMPQATPQAKSNAPLEKLTALAKSGNVMAQAVLGFDYLDGGNGVQINEAEAARWLERAANQGNAVAAYRLGTLYERGHGVPTDTGKAMQWYTVAAKQGNRKAMHNLAVAFAEGAGVPKNMSFAVQWFTRAASLGLSDSQFNLAVLYERGMGVPQSLTEAYKWYSIAAAQGDAESKTRVDALATQLTPADKQAAQHAADTFQPKPLDKAANNPPASTDIIGN